VSPVASAVVSFAAVAGLLTITPGLDSALVLRAAVRRSRGYAFATALGINSGALVWGAGAAVGVSALLTASTVAYTCLRIAGAVYMLWIGVRFLRAAVVGAPPVDEVSDGSGAAGATLWHGWRNGFLTNLLNPKIGAFYVAVLPQFIPPGTSPLLMGLLLALVHDVLGMLWFAALILAAGRMRRLLRRRTARRVVDGATGTVLVGFGLRLGLSAR
jgi:threonine/homoserine/homoserine lactone efflux protein